MTGAELNEVVGGLYPQPLPPEPPPELSRSIFSIFRSFGINQHFTFERIPPVLVLIYGGPSSAPARPPRAGVNRNVGLKAGRFFAVPMPTK